MILEIIVRVITGLVLLGWIISCIFYYRSRPAWSEEIFSFFCIAIFVVGFIELLKSFIGL